MKIAFIADIHGNSVALERVLEDIEKKRADKIVVLGDICFRGPDPKGSLEKIRQLETEVIKGNADEWIVRGIKKGEVPDQAFKIMTQERDFGVAQLSDDDILYLKNLQEEVKLTVGPYTIHGFHATPNSLFQNVMPDCADEIMEKNLMVDKTADIYVYAHIHKPFVRFLNGKIVMNTGSVGLPFDGVPSASYGIIEVDGKNVKAEICRVEYDVVAVVKMYETVNYPNSKQMMAAIRNGRLS